MDVTIDRLREAGTYDLGLHGGRFDSDSVDASSPATAVAASKAHTLSSRQGL